MATIKELNTIYDFSNKFSVSVKTRNSVFEQSDFMKMMKEFPNAYKICNKLYNNQNEDAILKLLVTPLFLDLAELKLTTNDKIAQDIGNVIVNKTKPVVEEILKNLDERIPDNVLIPMTVKTAIYTACAIINLDSYFRKKGQNIINEMELFDFDECLEESVLSNNDETYNYFSMNVFSNENDNEFIDEEDNPQMFDCLTEGIVGFGSSAYSYLDLLFKKSVMRFSSMISKKRLKPEQYNSLPGKNLLSCMITTLAMCYCASMFD